MIDNRNDTNRIVIEFFPDSLRVTQIGAYECVPRDQNDPSQGFRHHPVGEVDPVEWKSGEDQVGFYDPRKDPDADPSTINDFEFALAKCKEALDPGFVGDSSYAHRYVDVDANDYDASDVLVKDIIANTENKGKIYGHMLAFDPIYQVIKAEQEAADLLVREKSEREATRNAVYYNYSPSDDEHSVPATLPPTASFLLRAEELVSQNLFETEAIAYLGFKGDLANADKTPVLSRYFVTLTHDLGADPNSPDQNPFKAEVTKLPSALSDVSGLEVCIPLVTR